MADIQAAQDTQYERLYGSMVLAMEKAIEEINTHIRFILCILLLTSVGGLFNSWHILVTNFYAFVPPYWCKVPELEAADWTPQQIRAVSAVNNIEGSSCFIVGWNYTLFAELGYEKTLAFINSTTQPDKTACDQFYYDESNPSSSVVSEWNLVCGRRVQKSNVQGSIALGKFIGGLFCGFTADMVGRKPIFMMCCIIYFVFGVGAALTDIFWVFLIARFFLGIAGAGCYESGFTLLSELVGIKHRAALGCIYNMGYPIGHITLPILSMIFPTWRHLQLAISIPTVIFILHFWLLPESPRWLLVHGHPDKAWKIVKKFSKKQGNELPDSIEEAAERISEPVASAVGSFTHDTGERIPPPLRGQVKGAADSSVVGAQQAMKSRITPDVKISYSKILSREIKGVFVLFSTFELFKRIVISMFTFFTAGLVYYVIALNGANFHLNIYVYIFISGWVGIPGYVFPMLIMMCMGRKGASVLLFLASGLALVVITAVDRDQKYAILTLAMIGRFTNVAVFGLVTVYCAELVPTSVRNSAVGVSLSVSQLGSIYAPYLVDLMGPVAWYLPSTMCGIQTIVAALLILLLPETKGKSFPNTVEDVKNQSDKVSLRNCCKFS